MSLCFKKNIIFNFQIALFIIIISDFVIKTL